MLLVFLAVRLHNISYDSLIISTFLELLASIISSLMATRRFDMVRTAPQGRDVDGNIISDEPMELRRFNYSTGSIPSERYEELIRLMTKDFHQSLMLYHQLIQGNNSSSTKGEVNLN